MGEKLSTCVISSVGCHSGFVNCSHDLVQAIYCIGCCQYYTVWVKKSIPLNLFAVFVLRLSIFPSNFADLLPVYIHTPTNFGRFTLIFNKMALIFFRRAAAAAAEYLSFLLFQVSLHSKFQQVRLPLTSGPNISDLSPLDYQIWGNAGDLSKAATEAKNSSLV